MDKKTKHNKTVSRRLSMKELYTKIISSCPVKLGDRVMTNEEWTQEFPNDKAVFGVVKGIEICDEIAGPFIIKIKTKRGNCLLNVGWLEKR